MTPQEKFLAYPLAELEGHLTVTLSHNEAIRVLESLESRLGAIYVGDLVGISGEKLMKSCKRLIGPNQVFSLKEGLQNLWEKFVKEEQWDLEEQRQKVG